MTYNELAGTYARAGFYEEAAKCLGTMTGKGLLPNTFTYNAASHACLRRKGTTSGLSSDLSASIGRGELPRLGARVGCNNPN